jgi:hypothetical protein
LASLSVDRILAFGLACIVFMVHLTPASFLGKGRDSEKELGNTVARGHGAKSQQTLEYVYMPRRT